VAHLLKSRLLEGLGVRHGFNLRTGGVSQAAAYSSFNLGRAVGDDPELVRENHRRFAAAVGYDESALFETSQVHAAGVLTVAGSEAQPAVRGLEADALVAAPGGVAIGVRIADCAPVLLLDTESGAVAALHAGWRGTVRGVVAAGVQTLLQRGGGRSEALAAAIFPHIRRCCFEVGDDVAAELVAASPDPNVVDWSRGKPHVDLMAILVAQLAALGIPRERIDDIPGCTRCEPQRFFSFRRDGKQSGRHLAAIVSR
jgi:polyphenol oxidase